MSAPFTRVLFWSGIVLEVREEIGHAAHNNRGRHAGARTHLIETEYRREKGILRLFAARPCCGVTSGQFAAMPSRATVVTCSRCAAILARRAA